MERRRFLALGTASAAALAGCASGGPAGPGGTPRSPARVTTSSAEGIEILVAQIAFDDDSAGPDAYYRLRNADESDATIKIETVLSIEEGGTYSSFAVVTVPAGDEVTVRYRIVRFADLPEAERAKVRRGEGVSFEVFVNGERRDDA